MVEKVLYVDYSKSKFARRKNHVNEIESFWSFYKRGPSKFSGSADEKFYFIQKKASSDLIVEKNLYLVLMKFIKKNPTYKLFRPNTKCVTY